MKTTIEIHNNGNESGTFKVWRKVSGVLQCVTVTQDDVQSLLNRSQEEDFFLQDKSKYKFRVPESDVKEFFEKHGYDAKLKSVNAPIQNPKNLVKVNNNQGYDFYIGKDEDGKTIYNIVPEGYTEFSGGYYFQDYILLMKGIKGNPFSENQTPSTHI